VEWK